MFFVSLQRKIFFYERYNWQKEFVITKTYDENLRNKRCVFIEEIKTKKSVHITMITTYGVKHNKYWNNVQNEVLLDDLFYSEST